MGCCNKRAELNPKICEKLISDYAKRLSVRHIRALDFDRASHRFSYRLKLSPVQMLEMCKHLQISFDSPLVTCFFKNFYDEKELNYSVKKISLFGILFCKGLIEEKISMLFELYDIDTSGSLSRYELFTLLQDLFFVAIDGVLSYTLDVCNNIHKDTLVDYFKELNMIKRPLIKYYAAKFVDDHTFEVSREEYARVMAKEDMKLLVCPKKLRLYCIAVYNQIARQAQFVQKVLDDPEHYHKETIDLFEPKPVEPVESKPKRRRSLKPVLKK
jgi:hypothetical protein